MILNNQRNAFKDAKGSIDSKSNLLSKLNNLQAIRIEESCQDGADASNSQGLQRPPSDSDEIKSRMAFKYTVPAFEFAPEACHEQSYPEMARLFKSFRVQSGKSLPRNNYKMSSLEKAYKTQVMKKNDCSRGLECSAKQ